MPHDGQAWWGTVGCEQRGQVVRTAAVAFQLARRERVLEREVFRLGTATSGPVLFGVVAQHRAKRRPSRVEHVVMVVRVQR